jgi:hypothetical protein
MDKLVLALSAMLSFSLFGLVIRAPYAELKEAKRALTFASCDGSHLRYGEASLRAACDAAAAHFRLTPSATIDAMKAREVNYAMTDELAKPFQSKLQQFVWLKDFNAICDDAADDTAKIQAAWNYAASVGKNLYIGGVGTGVCKFSTLTAPTPTVGEFGNRSGLVGDGSGVTMLRSTARGVQSAITLSSTFGVNSDYNVEMRGFTLAGTAYGGTGIHLNRVTNLSFNDVRFRTFSYGIVAVDTLRITLINCWFYGIAIDGVHATFDKHTHPNAWTFINPTISFVVGKGLYFEAPATLTIVGGDFENNGHGNYTGAAIYVTGNPVEGTAGLNVTGGYYSNNNGLADIYIDGAETTNGVHTITGAEFDRNGATTIVASNIYVNNYNLGSTTLNLKASGFQGFNGYIPNATRPYVGFYNSVATNYVVNSGGNWFQSAVETPNSSWWNEVPWAIYTPMVGCGSGSAKDISATGRYKRISAKAIALNVVIVDATNGTCTGYNTVSLPSVTAPAGASVGNAYNTSTKLSGSFTAGPTVSSAILLSGAGGYFMDSGHTVWASLLFETL